MRLVGLKNHFKFYLILTVLATVSVFGNFLSIRRFWGSCRPRRPRRSLESGPGASAACFAPGNFLACF